ncbi:PucR family transcriptional regulator [Paenibacillus endoradicis]|uniref:PucR family transcriptional regulator n=1 Tax=Paenibacillus endoradicis TaxID=2972487 RepID=UPI002158EDB7|nr:PucR family transcriptional regulator [Paenibacillus endoradicis]MCR8656836.1 PucR family transcriptional regulator ligand-binding domain-containing protein [Paenibacillus endoradicis]
MLLHQLLNIEAFSQAEIIAGKQGLYSREVKAINIMDAPDIVTFLQEGDLLLTNGYILKQRPNSIIDFIVSMNHKGVAGLAIKTKRFFFEISQEAINKANELNFPLIELSSSQYTLGETFQKSIAFMLESKNEELHYALNIHKHFSDMILHNNGQSRIIETLSHDISQPVLLVDMKGQVKHEVNSSSSAVLASFASSFITELKKSEPMESKVSLALLGKIGQFFQFVEIFPIWAHRHEATLFIFSEKKAISNLSLLAAEQAAHVLGLEIVKKQAVKERSRRYKNEFFSDLIDGYISNEQEVLRRGSKYGLSQQFTGRMLVIALDHAGLIGSKRNYEQHDPFIGEREDQYELIKQQFQLQGYLTTLFTKNEWFTVLLYENSEEQDDLNLIDKLHSIIQQLDSNEGLSFSIGVGSLVNRVLDLSTSYREAFDTLHAQLSINKQRVVKVYEEMEISRVLRLIPEHELRKFYDEAFKGRLTEQNIEIFHTVKSYYENNCQIHDTAKSLFVHRNTVIYRLEKYERLTGRLLKDANESLKFRIACEIDGILHENPHF